MAPLLRAAGGGSGPGGAGRPAAAVLRLRGEHEFAVPPLPVAPADVAPDPADLQRYASVSHSPSGHTPRRRGSS